MLDKRLLFILITIFLDTLGIGLLVPSFPKIVGRFASDPSVVSEYFGLFVASYALMQFIAAPILGALSDQWGRKIILLCSLLGAALDYLFMAYAPSFGWLLVGRMLSGLTGASMTVATSYIVDISDTKNRSQNFGLIGAAWGLGFIAGPVMGAALDLLSPQAPFHVAATLNLFTFLFGLFVLPESLSEANRRQLKLAELNPFRSILKILKNAHVAPFVWIYFLIFLAGQALPVNWTLYTQLKFQWTPLQLGFSLSFMGIVIAISQVTLTRYLIPRLGEERSVSVGIFFYIVSFFFFSLASQAWMLYGTILLFAFTGITNPAIQALMTKQTPVNQQGELQGSLVSLGSLTSVIAPLFFTPIFVQFTENNRAYYFPGIIFLMASLISTFTLLLWLVLRRRGLVKA